CFWVRSTLDGWSYVFPTPVGVFPTTPLPPIASIGLPHARGGVSQVRQLAHKWARSSPRPWGCFPRWRPPPTFTMVFPTPVGVFPISPIAAHSLLRLPHARGGVSSRS